MNRLLQLQSLLGNKWRFIVYPLLALVLFSLSNLSSAQEAAPAFRVLDGIDATFKPFQMSWQSAIKLIAQSLFWSLVGVDFAWSGVIYVLDKNTIEEIVISLVKKMFTIGFFFSLLKFCDTWIPAIIDSFRKIGQDVGGTTATPDGLLMKGFDLATGIIGLLSKLGLADAVAMALPLWLCAFIIFACFCFVAAVLLVTTIESYLVVGAGVILLGFGGSRWTTDMATKYLQSAVGTGLKLMMLYLVVGAGQTIVSGIVIDSAHLVQSIFVTIGTMFVYAYIVIQVPAIAAGLMSGSPALTASGLAGAALGIGAAAAGVGAVAKGMAPAAASGVGGAVAGAAGLTQALGAGLNSAGDMGLNGVGAASHAAGQVAGHGVGMAAGAIGGMVAGGAQSFGERVAGSTGGKIASSIEASRGGAMSSAGSSAASSGASSPAPAAGGAAAGSGTANSAAPASGSAANGSGNAAAPGPAPAQSGLGDASTASISGGNEGAGTQSQGSGNQGGGDGGRKPAMHEQIRDLQGFVPQDHAQMTAMQINAGHTQD